MDDTDVVYDKVGQMVEVINQQLGARVDACDNKFSTQIRRIYSEELSQEGLFGDIVGGKENKFGKLKEYLLDQDTKSIKLNKELKDLIELHKKSEYRLKK